MDKNQLHPNDSHLSLVVLDSFLFSLFESLSLRIADLTTAPRNDTPGYSRNPIPNQKSDTNATGAEQTVGPAATDSSDQTTTDPCYKYQVCD